MAKLSKRISIYKQKMALAQDYSRLTMLKNVCVMCMLA